MANALFYETESGKKPVAKFLKEIPVQARAKCAKYISMLEEHGLSLPGQYLEKVRGDLWPSDRNMAVTSTELFSFIQVTMPPLL